MVVVEVHLITRKMPISICENKTYMAYDSLGKSTGSSQFYWLIT